MTLAFELPTPIDSIVRRFDPRWKIVTLLVGVIVILALWHLDSLAVLFLGCLCLTGLSRLPLRWYGNRVFVLLPMLLALVLFLPLALHDNGSSWNIGPVRLSLYGLIVAIRLSLKAVAILTLMLVLIGTTPIPDLLKAAHSLRIPGFLIQLTSLTFRYLMLLVEEFGRLRIALRVRGFRNRANLQSYRVVGNVTGTLLVRSLERAERVGQAMRCRGFDGSYRALTEFRTTGRDVLLAGVFVAFVGLVLLWDVWHP